MRPLLLARVLPIILILSGIGAIAWSWASRSLHPWGHESSSAPLASGVIDQPRAPASKAHGSLSQRAGPEVLYGSASPVVNYESWDALFEQITQQVILAAANGVQPDWSGIGVLQQKIEADPRLLVEIMRHAAREHRPEALDVLRMVLTGNVKPEVRDFATRLAIEGAAPQRRLAFDLLRDHPASAEINRLAMQAIATEQDPVALASALAALRPIHAPEANAFAAAGSQAPTSDLEKQAMANTLHSLMQHDSPAVRSLSLTALGEWETNQDAMFATVSVALADDAPQVRQAALTTLVSRPDAKAFKRPLVQLLASEDEDIQVQAMAWQILQDIPMTDAERALHDETYTLLAASFQPKKVAAGE